MPRPLLIAVDIEGKVMTILLGLVLPGILLGTSPVSSPRFVPGEVLVKFVPGSDGGAAVMQASRVSPPDLGALAQVIDRLQAKVNIPLRAKQVTGGQWVLLSVGGEKLTDQLLEKLRGRESVAEGQPLQGEVDEDATAVAQIDLAALTLKLSEQLKALADIESAQPNYILRIQ